MTDSINNGGPAFPTQTYDQGAAQAGFAVTVTDNPGMTLRDWFAGQALASLAGATANDGSDFLHTLGPKAAARWAYAFADAMLEARK